MGRAMADLLRMVHWAAQRRINRLRGEGGGGGGESNSKSHSVDSFPLVGSAPLVFNNAQGVDAEDMGGWGRGEGIGGRVYMSMSWAVGWRCVCVCGGGGGGLSLWD